MNIYTKILLSPKRAFEDPAFTHKKPQLLKFPLFMMAATIAFDILYILDDIISKDNHHWGLILIILISIGVVFLMIGLIVPWLIRLFGKIWKGKATMRQLVNVYASSYVPFTLILVYQLPMFLLGLENNINPAANYIILLWSWSLSIIGVAKVQGFSYGIALLNILMSYIPFMLIGILKN